MKALKYWGFGPRKSKSGFTLIELLIVMVILAILAGVVVMAVGGVFGSAHEAAYNSVHDDVQNAVVAYATDNNGQFPFLAGTVNYSITKADGSVVVCPTCRIINMSVLLTSAVPPGMLRDVPDGIIKVAGVNNDNCDGSTAIDTSCLLTNSYMWLMDSMGNVYSKCTTSGGGTCDNTSRDGFQTAWP